jgi:hypothetical protein
MAPTGCARWIHSVVAGPSQRRSTNFGKGQPVLARRGDVVLAHYLLAHNQSGNTAIPLRRIVYYRLAAEGHRDRWAATHTDALFEYAPVRVAISP